jgi:dihydrofolate reductase
LDELNTKDNIEEIFIIWGSQLYNQVLSRPDLEKIFLTKVQWDFDCDVFFDWVPDDFELESKTDITEENEIKYNFNIYSRKD